MRGGDPWAGTTAAWKWVSAQPLAIRQRTREGPLALCAGVGLSTRELLFERELEEKIA